MRESVKEKTNAYNDYKRNLVLGELINKIEYKKLKVINYEE